MPGDKTQKKNKGGRPAIVLDERQVAQVEALAAYLTQAQIANYLGIAESTFWHICQRQPAVSEAYKRGRAAAVGSVAQTLLEKARDGDTASMIFYLKTQGGWRETSRLEVESEARVTVNQRAPEELSDEELARIVDESSE